MTEHPVRSILVPLDGTDLSAQVIPYAVALAGQGSTITLLQVTPEAEPLRKPFGAITMSADEVLALVNELAQADLDRAESAWAPQAAGITFQKRVATGDATEVILQVADEENVDVIAVASAGRGALGRLALGSVTDRLVRSSDKPVLVVREEEEGREPGMPRIARVIVPLDGSDRSELALPVAGAIAQQLGASIELLTAVDLPQVVAPSMAYGTTMMAPELYEEIQNETAATAQNHLTEAATTLDAYGITPTTHVVHGPATHAIMEFAQPTDLVVMTSRGQGGLKRWILGSVAEKLIRDCAAPILLVPSHHHE